MSGVLRDGALRYFQERYLMGVAEHRFIAVRQFLNIVALHASTPFIVPPEVFDDLLGTAQFMIDGRSVVTVPIRLRQRSVRALGGSVGRTLDQFEDKFVQGSLDALRSHGFSVNAHATIPTPFVWTIVVVPSLVRRSG